MTSFWVQVGIRFVLLVMVVLRVVAVLLAVQYVGLAYEVDGFFADLVAGARWMMPDLSWCLLWYLALPSFSEYLSEWLDEEGEQTASESGVPIGG
jgi:hypothetical protein